MPAGSDGVRRGAVALSRARVTGAAVIACGHPIAAEIGGRVLAEGGNAVDAVIAAAFASFVVEPAQCGLGGHGRMSIRLARDGACHAIDHFIRAPAGATPDAHAASGGDSRITGARAIGIPGAVAGLCEAQHRFATRRLAALMAPAIALADAGLEVDRALALQIAGRAREIANAPGAAALLFEDGLPKRPASWSAPGGRLDLAPLARSLRLIAERGAAAFHDGPLADAIAREVQAQGGLLTRADLAGFRPRLFSQPRHAYRERRYVTAGDTIAVEALNILERFAPEDDETRERHLFAEALGCAFVDHFAHAGDPAQQRVPLDGLASKAYAAARAEAIAPDRAGAARLTGDPWPHQAALHGTTQICAADRDGNVAALITSLGSAFGSLVMVPDTGILLGNAMQWFDPRPGRLNSIAPGRMPLYAAPVLIAEDESGALGAIVGSGGYRIQTAVLGPLLALIDRRLSGQEAIDRPRLHAEGGVVDIDIRVPESVRAALARLGHRLRVVDPAALGGGLGRASLVWRSRDGWEAAAESWSGGTAACG